LFQTGYELSYERNFEPEIEKKYRKEQAKWFLALSSKLSDDMSRKKPFNQHYAYFKYKEKKVR
jgi:hypothetical protein